MRFMAGKPQKGLKFAGWSVNIFDGDTKIDKLLEAQGWVGFGIYFYLCQMAYKFDEYFYRWTYDDSATTARRMGGGVKSETVKQTVRLCLQIGLFDKRLFDRDGILTSRGIQRRFCAAAKTKRRRLVIADYWLLDEDESEGLEMCAANNDSRSANGDLPLADGDSHRTNETKEKETKGNQRKVLAQPHERWGLGEALDAALAKWLAYKEEKHRPCTPTELDCLVDQVREQSQLYGDKAVVDVILLSISSGWQGVAWDRLGKQPGPPGSMRGGPGTAGVSEDAVKDDMARMRKYQEQLRKEMENGEL